MHKCLLYSKVLQILPFVVNFVTEVLLKCTSLKGVVLWIFLSTYVAVLISGYTLLFIETKTDQYFLRYLQKHARILAVLKKQFIQEITVTWKATCRKHYLSPSDITGLHYLYAFWLSLPFPFPFFLIEARVVTSLGDAASGCFLREL